MNGARYVIAFIFIGVLFSCRYGKPFLSIKVLKTNYTDSISNLNVESKHYRFFRPSQYGIFGLYGKKVKSDTLGQIMEIIHFRKSAQVFDGKVKSRFKKKVFEKGKRKKIYYKSVKSYGKFPSVHKADSIIFDANGHRLRSKKAQIESNKTESK